MQPLHVLPYVLMHGAEAGSFNNVPKDDLRKILTGEKEMEDGEIIPCCDRCGRWNHFRPACRETTNVNGVPLDRTLCSKCGRYGHHRRVCWHIVAPPMWCKRCARYGHVESECRSRYCLYGTDMWDIARCTKCWRYGHNERRCRAEQTVFGDELRRDHGSRQRHSRYEGERGRRRPRDHRSRQRHDKSPGDGGQRPGKCKSRPRERSQHGSSSSDGSSSSSSSSSSSDGSSSSSSGSA